MRRRGEERRDGDGNRSWRSEGQVEVGWCGLDGGGRGEGSRGEHKADDKL